MAILNQERSNHSNLLNNLDSLGHDVTYLGAHPSSVPTKEGLEKSGGSITAGQQMHPAAFAVVAAAASTKATSGQA